MGGCASAPKTSEDDQNGDQQTANAGSTQPRDVQSADLQVPRTKALGQAHEAPPAQPSQISLQEEREAEMLSAPQAAARTQDASPLTYVDAHTQHTPSASHQAATQTQQMASPSHQATTQTQHTTAPSQQAATQTQHTPSPSQQATTTQTEHVPSPSQQATTQALHTPAAQQAAAQTEDSPAPQPQLTAVHTQTAQPELISADTQVTPRTSASGSEGSSCMSDLPEHVSLQQVLLEESQDTPPFKSLREAYAQQREQAEAQAHLQQEYQALSQQYTTLQQQQQQQQAVVATSELVHLQQQHTALQDRHSRLHQQHSSMRAAHAQLSQRVGDLRALLQSLGYLGPKAEHTNKAGGQAHGDGNDSAGGGAHESVLEDGCSPALVEQLIAACKAQHTSLVAHNAQMQQANNELEKLKMERESVQRAHDAAFDAGEAARTQVLQLQAELEDLRASASAPPVATHVHRSNAEGAQSSAHQPFPASQVPLQASLAERAHLQSRLTAALKEKENLALQMAQARAEAMQERKTLQQAAQEAATEAQALRKRLDGSEKAAADARRDAEQLAAELRSNYLVNEHTAGQTDTLLKDYAQLKERHLALLQDMDAKHNMIELLSHQFDEVEIPDVRSASSRRQGSHAHGAKHSNHVAAANGVAQNT